ncbi:MAG: hypothetical protein Q8Q39_00910 [bacterium]|nr:hypothetical protein [bacterium]
MKLASKIILTGIAIVFGFTVFTHLGYAQDTITEIKGYQLLVPLPNFAGEEAPDTLAELVRFIYRWMTRIVAIAAFIMLVVGGMQYVFSGGNQSKASDAKDQIVHALLGLAVVLASYLILNTINPSLVNFGSTELPNTNLPVSQNFDAPPESQSEGRCFDTSELGSAACRALGGNWQPLADGCAGQSCQAGGSSGEICCSCAGTEQDCPTEYSCVEYVNDTPSGNENEVVCGPYVRSDCNGQCESSLCEPGNYCGERASEPQRFQILVPAPPDEGNPFVAIPYTPGGSVTITIDAPESVEIIQIRVWDPSGNQVPITPTDRCPAAGEGCTIQWTPQSPVAGTYTIEAIGLDGGGQALAGMTDRRFVCFIGCGPTAAFEVSPAPPTSNPGAFHCGANTYAIGPSGEAVLLLDGGYSISASRQAIVSYEWRVDGQFIFESNPYEATTETSLPPGTYDITLTVYTEGTGAQDTSDPRRITIVPVCST